MSFEDSWKRVEYRFPLTTRVFDKVDKLRNISSVGDNLRLLGYMFLSLGTIAVDFPGALIKTGKYVHNNLKRAQKH
jgi:hypothetical protein